MGQSVCRMDMRYPVILLTERIIVFLYLNVSKLLVHTRPQSNTARASALHYQLVLVQFINFIFLILVSFNLS